MASQNNELYHHYFQLVNRTPPEFDRNAKKQQQKKRKINELLATRIVFISLSAQVLAAVCFERVVP
jgi:hypothetical protein